MMGDQPDVRNGSKADISPRQFLLSYSGPIVLQAGGWACSLLACVRAIRRCRQTAPLLRTLVKIRQRLPRARTRLRACGTGNFGNFRMQHRRHCGERQRRSNPVARLDCRATLAM